MFLMLTNSAVRISSSGVAAPQGDFYRELGKLLRSARKTKGITQERLARAVALSRTSITNIELGQQPVPAHILVALARALGIRPADLLPQDPATAKSVELPDHVRKLSTAKQNWVTRVLSTGDQPEIEDDAT